MLAPVNNRYSHACHALWGTPDNHFSSRTDGDYRWVSNYARLVQLFLCILWLYGSVQICMTLVGTASLCKIGRILIPSRTANLVLLILIPIYVWSGHLDLSLTVTACPNHLVQLERIITLYMNELPPVTGTTSFHHIHFTSTMSVLFPLQLEPLLQKPNASSISPSSQASLHTTNPKAQQPSSQ